MTRTVRAGRVRATAWICLLTAALASVEALLSTPLGGNQASIMAIAGPVVCMMAFWISNTLVLRGSILSRISVVLDALYAGTGLGLALFDLALARRGFVCLSLLLFVLNAVSFRRSQALKLNYGLFLVAVLVSANDIGMAYRAEDGASLGTSGQALLLSAAVLATQHVAVLLRRHSLSELGRLRRHIGDQERRWRRSEQLARMRDEVARLNRISVIEAMLSSVANELNQPLGSALTFTEAARRWLRKEPPHVTTALDGIDDAIGQMTRIAPALSNMRSMVARTPTEPELFDLGSYLENLIEILKIGAMERRADLQFVPPPSPIVIRGLEDELGQGVMNLVTNCLEAFPTSQASCTIVVSLVRANDGWTSLTVADNGPGMSHHSLNAGFYSTKDAGGGLGLSICRNIAEAHGGSLLIESSAEAGTSVTLRLPPAETNAGG